MALSQEIIVRVLFAARSRLSAAAWLVVRDAQAAEDIFQNVSVKALTKGVPFEHEAQLLSWAHVTVRHEAIDWLRRQRTGLVPLEVDVLELLEAEWAAEPTSGPSYLDSGYRVLDDRVRWFDTLGAKGRATLSAGRLNLYVQGAWRGLVADSLPEQVLNEMVKVGFPIRKSPDQSLLTTPRRLSQRATSFFACTCQGIHQMLLPHA